MEEPASNVFMAHFIAWSAFLPIAVWFYIAYRYIQFIRKLIQITGVGLSTLLSPGFLAARAESENPEVREKIKAFKTVQKKMFLLWILTLVGYVVLLIIVGGISSVWQSFGSL